MVFYFISLTSSIAIPFFIFHFLKILKLYQMHALFSQNIGAILISNLLKTIWTTPLYQRGKFFYILQFHPLPLQCSYQ